MKKGVFAKLVSLVVIVLIFSVLSGVVWAPPGSGLTGGGGDTGPGVAEENPSDSDRGFWKACLSEDGVSCTYPPYGEGEYPKPHVDNPQVDLKNIYSSFGVVSGTSEIPEKEILYLKYSVLPLLFTTPDLGTFSSHGLALGEGYETVDDFNYYLEGGSAPMVPNNCYTCSQMIDNIMECFTPDPESDSYPFEFDWTCIEVDILDRENCSEMADLNGPFCEGLQGMGPNADFYQYGTSEPMIVSQVGQPGRGGCSEITAPSTVPARDWFWYTTTRDEVTDTVVQYGDLSKPLTSIFSGYYMPGSSSVRASRLAEVGRCCGNDALDAGALMRGSSASGTFDNYFICVQDRQGNFVWMPAADSNNIGMIWNTTVNLEGTTYRFDAVSNTNDWFVCDSPNSMDGVVYSDADLEDWADTANGPLLKQYERLPAHFTTVNYGTTYSLGGGEGEEGPMTGTDTTESIDPNDNSESGFASQSDFENAQMDVFGFESSNVCDKDGDGYDGQWTLDEYRGGDWVYDDSYPGCSEPSEPYDCDDSRSDVHPGMIDYCDGSSTATNSVDNDCDGDASPCIPLPEDGRPPGGEEGELIPPEVYKRFMCHQTDDAGAFAECCSYDLGWCMNYMKGRREGGPINTINDFSHYGNIMPEGSNTTNMVLKYVTSRLGRIDVEDSIANDEEFRLGLPKRFYDEKLTNWSGYGYVEFYVWTTTNFVLDIGLAKKKSPISDSSMFKSYVVRFRKPVIEYAVNEPGLRKWMHIKIPIDDIYGEDRLDYFPVDLIVFFTNIRGLKDSGSSEVRVDWNNDGFLAEDELYSNYVGIDKFFLTPKSSDLLAEGDENYYCSGVWPAAWISDLDRDVPEDEPEGRSACNAIPSYGWTGSRCCGDDTGNDLIDVGHAELAFKEFYADTDAGCWSGNVITEDERAMIVRYGMYYGVEYDSTDLGLHEVVDRDCSRSSCVFSLPLRPEIFVSNPHPELYDLVAFQGDERVTINQSYLPGEAISQIKAEDVPLQVQFRGGEFWACNPADYIKTLEADDGSLLIPDDGDHYFGSCEVNGRYFCDHADGTDLGWSDESLLKYPGSPLTLRDGSLFELPGDAVPPTNRTEEKYAYNIIKNPGFEEV
ncbi:putative metal-binding motif-containing protein [Candidatus Woesearchaeota archaeon]|nr:putative metal-binding motif-containing protein [Candidatus Woesearchaeota archaeon]